MRSRFLLFIWHYFKQLRARWEGFGGKTAGITTLLRDTSLHDLCHFWHNIFKNRSRFCASSSKTNEGCVCLCETAARQIYFFVLFFEEGSYQGMMDKTWKMLSSYLLWRGGELLRITNQFSVSSFLFFPFNWENCWTNVTELTNMFSLVCV